MIKLNFLCNDHFEAMDPATAVQAAQKNGWVAYSGSLGAALRNIRHIQNGMPPVSLSKAHESALIASIREGQEATRRALFVLAEGKAPSRRGLMIDGNHQVYASGQFVFVGSASGNETLGTVIRPGEEGDKLRVISSNGSVHLGSASGFEVELGRIVTTRMGLLVGPQRSSVLKKCDSTGKALGWRITLPY